MLLQNNPSYSTRANVVLTRIYLISAWKTVNIYHFAMKKVNIKFPVKLRNVNSDDGKQLKPGSHLCDKHNTSDISISISTRKKERVPFFLCLCLCLCRLCYAYRTSGNQALALYTEYMLTLKISHMSGNTFRNICKTHKLSSLSLWCPN